MPRKPKVEKRTATIIANDKPIQVTLHPPTGARKSWYAYWNGLATSNTQEAALYCPNDMPLPPNGVWRPGLPAQ